MFDSVIRSGAVVDRAILDKEVVVGQGAIVGEGPYDDRPNKQEPNRLNTGITVVGKRAVVPRGARIGRNVKIAADVALVGLHRARRPERRIGRDPAGPARRAASTPLDARRRRSAERAVVGAAAELRPARGTERSSATTDHRTARAADRRRSVAAISARLPGPCHPPKRAPRACARPMSRTGSRTSG